MEFKIGDLVVLYGNFTKPYKIIAKGHFFSEFSPNNEEILYKLSDRGEAWYSERCLESYDNKNY